MKKVMALTYADLKNISRDSTLILLLLAPVLILFFLSLGLPLISGVLLEKYSFDLSIHYVFILSFFCLMPSMLFGLLVGFTILDERDEEIITYIAVTPLGKKGYFIYKILFSSLLSLIFFFIMINTAGLSYMSLQYSIGIALMVALEAPIHAIFLAAFAENKVEGLAFSKISGLMFIAPFVAYFVKSDLQYIAGLLPPFWVTKAFFASQQGEDSFWLFLLIGIILHIIFILLLLKRFFIIQR